jgi:hypothetical protein
MGHSRTISLVGWSEMKDMRQDTLAYAESLLDMYQATIKNKQLILWQPQTRKGEALLEKWEACGGKPKGLVKCICKRENGCFICNGSGITTRKHIQGFQDWQIEMAKAGK